MPDHDKDRFSIGLESIGECAIATDKSRKVAWINDSARRLTGWQGDTAIGRSLEEVVHVADLDTAEPIAIPAAEELVPGVALPERVALTSRDGQIHQVNWMVTPVYRNGRAGNGAAIVFRDVTEEILQRQALDDERSNLTTIIKATNTATWNNSNW